MSETRLDAVALEQRIAWLHALRPDNAVEAIVNALAEGAPEEELWAAGALTSARYLNNQARNLLGFVTHAMIGCEDARALAAGQPRRTRELLLIQALYQVVCDLYDPCFAPHALPPYWPTREVSVAENVTQLRADVRFGEYMRVDHRLTALAQDLPRAALIDLLLDIGLEGMVTDDHTLITPVLCLGMVDLVGWDRGYDMLRWALRYSASFPRNFTPYDHASALREQYGLTNGPPASGLQPERIEALRAALHAAAPHDRPEFVARALADGVSPETILATAALVCCDMYLMTEPVPHDDYDAVSREVAPIHLGTTLDSLRSALPKMTPATRALAAIQTGGLLERGPSVLSPVFEFVPFELARPYPYTEDVAALTGYTPLALLAALRTALPAHDHRTATAAVRAYAEAGGDPEPLIALLTDVACTDNGTLLHNFKHLHAMVEGFRNCHLPDRWSFLICAARWVAWYAGVTIDAYERAIASVSLNDSAAQYGELTNV